MKDTDYEKLIEFTHINGTFIPSNQNAIDLISNIRDGEKVYMKLVTSRDLKLFKCYFVLLNYIWLWMPDEFKKEIHRDIFYQYLKIKQGQFDIRFKFKDNGLTMIEYHSIALGKMSNEQFREFVKEQISVIYNEVLMNWFDDEKANHIIEETEKEFEKFFAKL